MQHCAGFWGILYMHVLYKALASVYTCLRVCSGGSVHIAVCRHLKGLLGQWPISYSGRSWERSVVQSVF